MYVSMIKRIALYVNPLMWILIYSNDTDSLRKSVCRQNTIESQF